MKLTDPILCIKRYDKFLKIGMTRIRMTDIDRHLSVLDGAFLYRHQYKIYSFPWYPNEAPKCRIIHYRASEENDRHVSKA